MEKKILLVARYKKYFLPGARLKSISWRYYQKFVSTHNLTHRTICWTAELVVSIVLWGNNLNQPSFRLII